MSDLPFPRELDKRNCNSQKLPFPLNCPSDGWLATHKDIIYDTTENWERSEFRLRLGTIAINYNLGDDISKTTFGVKVAFKDKYGYPQIWRDLPFIQPDLNPYIKQIAESISAVLSSAFVSHQEFTEITSDLSIAIRTISQDSSYALSVANVALLSASNVAGVAEDAKAGADGAMHIAKEAQLSASIALLDASDANKNASEALLSARDALAFANEVKSIASDAMLSAGEALDVASIAYKKADSVEELATEAKTTAGEAVEIAEAAEKDASRAQDIADDAMWHAQHDLVSTDRLIQGKNIIILSCGNAEDTILQESY